MMLAVEWDIIQNINNNLVCQKRFLSMVKTCHSLTVCFACYTPAKRSFRGVYCFQPVHDSVIPSFCHSVIPSFRQHFDIFAE